MNAYFWYEPWPVKYGQSFVMAVADSLDEAKAQAIAAAKLEPGIRHAPHDLVLGEPTRTAELPCGEAFEWEE